MVKSYSLKLDSVYKHYSQKGSSINRKSFSGTKIVKAVDGISLEILSGEILGIVGESGCGKSTLAKLIVNLEELTKGRIFFEDGEIDELFKKDNLYFRKTVQMVFQNPFDSFDPRYTVSKILIETLNIHNIGGSKKERYDIITKGLEEVGLIPAKEFLERYPHELSGGQLQRISILRTMLLKPKVLIADEPVSMLDVSVRADIIKMLQTLAKINNTTLLFISHDINTVRYISDRVVVMYLGKIVEEGITDDVLHNPQHPYTKALISNCSSIDVFEERKKIKISGEPPSPIDTGPGCYFAPRCSIAIEKCRKVYPERIQINNDHSASCHLIKNKI